MGKSLKDLLVTVTIAALLLAMKRNGLPVKKSPQVVCAGYYDPWLHFIVRTLLAAWVIMMGAKSGESQSRRDRVPVRKRVGLDGWVFVTMKTKVQCTCCRYTPMGGIWRLRVFKYSHFEYLMHEDWFANAFLISCEKKHSFVLMLTITSAWVSSVELIFSTVIFVQNP